MATPRSRGRKPFISNKENTTSGLTFHRRPQKTIKPPSPITADSPNEERQPHHRRRHRAHDSNEEQEGEGENGTPFVGLSKQDIGALRSIAAQKRSGVGRVEVLRDVTGEFANRGRVGRGGKGKVEEIGGGEEDEEEEAQGSDPEGVEALGLEEEEEEPEISFAKEEEASNIESDHEAYVEQSRSPPYASPQNTSSESLDNAENSETSSILTTSSLDLNAHNSDTPQSQPPRTDNIALCTLLHPSSHTDLRTTHLSNISLSQKWHLRKRRLITDNPDRIHESPPTPEKIPYKRPKDRKITRSWAKPAAKLWRHLGLYDPESQPARKLLGWLRKEDELLLSQVSLVAPRMQFQHIREVHEHAFLPLRLQLLEYLRKEFENCTWCLFFSEFVYANHRHLSSNYETTVNGSCLFLMVSTEETGKIKKVAEGMLKNLKFGAELAVFVRNGNPRLFGSYGLKGGRGEYEDEDDEGEQQTGAQGTSGSGIRLGWPNVFQRIAETTLPAHQNTPKKTPHTPSPPPDSNSSGISSWNPSPTPSPHSPIPNIRSIHWDKPIYWRELDAFSYGLRWVTKLGVPSAHEGENAKYSERPNLGSSLGARADFGSGTLAGYLSDRKGTVYAMTCHHVLYFLDAVNIWPISSNAIINHSASQPISPSATDLKYQTRATAHQIDGLMHEAIRAYTRGNKPLAEILTNEGKEKLEEHDKLVEEVKNLKNEGAGFGGIVASAWKIARVKEGAWIMDQVVFKPRFDRIGTNTFTYTGRDNKGGRRYRLEARGWTHLPLGAEVLKLGRTTGLTKGTVISLEADVRLLVGEVEQEFPKVHKVQKFWEVKSGIITSGTGPWFSESGDSGSWILANPSFEDMLRWDLRRSGGKMMADPIPAPVGGMLFGGADSVDGISLTFYNPTKIIRRYLVEMLGGRLGRELKPGFGGEVIPAPLGDEWEEQDSWSRQSEKTADAWADFVDKGFWKHQLEGYSDNHVFRNSRYDTAVEGKGKTAVRDTEPRRDKGREEDEETKPTRPTPQKQPSKLKIRFAEPTPRRKGTNDDIPDTPVSTLSKVRKVTPPYVPTEGLVREVTPGKYTSASNRKVGGAYVLGGTRPGYSKSGRKRVQKPVARIEKDYL